MFAQDMIHYEETVRKEKTVVKKLLILGDSHLLGSFGEYLHRNLHESGKYDIMSISIGGAGSRNFINRLLNQCCGYKIRLTTVGQKIPEDQKLPVTESASVMTEGYIVQQYNGYLKDVLSGWKPDGVLIALGSNNVNAHRELVDIIEAYDSLAPLVWIGPFKRADIESRYRAIEKVMNATPQGLLVRSDDILGNDTITMGHFYGKVAKNWALKVIERMQGFLDQRFGYIKEEEVAPVSAE